MQKSAKWGIVVAIMMIALGMFYPIPEKFVNVDSGSKAYDYDWRENKGAEYLGGDAYNYMIEATMKSGYVSGIMTGKVAFVVGGLLLFFISLYAYNQGELLERKNEISYNMHKDVEEIKWICKNP